MKIAKEFRWEMGHRLPNHEGECRNIHGHSYKMIVELEGVPNKENGMIIDFYDLGIIIKPILEKYDHSFLVMNSDKVVLDFLKKNKMKRVVVDYIATVENICDSFLKIFSGKLKSKKFNNIKSVTVKIFETPNSYAEKTLIMK
jgi:6-pyruvoyltetrahydropterin/6-carboxytetrahydropterin synthase